MDSKHISAWIGAKLQLIYDCKQQLRFIRIMLEISEQYRDQSGIQYYRDLVHRAETALLNARSRDSFDSSKC